MQITADPRELAAALKAVRIFVSKDETRSNICGVRAAAAKGKLQLTATDGHTGCQVEIHIQEKELTETACLTQAELEILTATAKVNKHYTSAAFELPNDPNITFPSYEQDVPVKLADAGQTVQVHRYNGTYLARLGAVQTALKASSAVLQLGADAKTPLRADITGPFATATVVIMPMRM